MDNVPDPGRLPSFRMLHRLGGVLHRWWRVLLAARAAEATYETARAHSVTHDIAARETFEALTRDAPPTPPELASGVRLEGGVPPIASS